MRWCLCKGATQINFAPSTIQSRTSRPAVISLWVSPPFHFKGAIDFGLENASRYFIKTSIIAGSVAPSDNEEDIYYG